MANFTELRFSFPAFYCGLEKHTCACSCTLATKLVNVSQLFLNAAHMLATVVIFDCLEEDLERAGFVSCKKPSMSMTYSGWSSGNKSCNFDYTSVV